MNDAIIIDIDGTFANISHRIKFLDMSSGVKNWDKFFDEMINDTPNFWCETLLAYLSNSIFKPPFFLFVTGRPEKYRGITNDWIREYISRPVSEYSLYMRKENDYRPDYVIKKEIYETYIKQNYNVIFCLDDKKRVAEMWRDQGLVCLDCSSN